jgi:hypothetical protein
MEIFIVLLILAVIAYFTGSVARSKGREQGLWTLLGACFGMIALLILACLSDRPTPTWEGSGRES